MKNIWCLYYQLFVYFLYHFRYGPGCQIRPTKCCRTRNGQRSKTSPPTANEDFFYLVCVLISRKKTFLFTFLFAYIFICLHFYLFTYFIGFAIMEIHQMMKLPRSLKMICGKFFLLFFHFV